MEEFGVCKSGIRALDEILEGGCPEGHSILVAGASGTGKTVLTSELLFRGAKEFGETGLYLSLTESADRMKRNLSKFDFFDEELVDSGKVNFLEIEHDAWLMGVQPQSVHDVLSRIKSIIDEVKPRRIVIDSVTAVCNNLKDEGKIREFIFRLGFELSRIKCTLFLISETPPLAFQYSVFGVEEFIADGIILLNEFERNGDLVRTLQVIKMRGVDHSRNKQVMNITSRGVELIPMFKGGSGP
ncbi:MAG: ATPase domain-containing protein [Candidatus Altiarchaeota archaeon]